MVLEELAAQGENNPVRFFKTANVEDDPKDPEFMFVRLGSNCKC